MEREKNTLAEHVANIKAQHAAERDMLIMEHHKSIGALEERLRTEANQRVQAGKYNVVKYVDSATLDSLLNMFLKQQVIALLKTSCPLTSVI